MGLKKRLMPTLVAVCMIFAMVLSCVKPVRAAAPDVDPPEVDIESISFDFPEGRKTLTVGDVIGISATVTDASRIKYVNFALLNTNTGKTVDCYADYNSETDRWEVNNEITEDTISGDWMMYTIYVCDENSNNKYYWNKAYTESTPSYDFSAFDFVVEGTDPDVEPPEVDIESISFDFPEGRKTLTAGDVIGISATVTDASAIKYVYFGFLNTNTGKTVNCYANYNSETDRWEVGNGITENTSIGDWMLYTIYVCDEHRNNKYYWNKAYTVSTPSYDFSAFDYIVEGTEADVDPPEVDISSISFDFPDDRKTLIAGDVIGISATVTDASEIKYVNFGFLNTNTGKTINCYADYNSDSDRWEVDNEITENTPLGDWMLYTIYVCDNNSNNKYYWNQEYTESTPNYDFSEYDFTVCESCKITFDTRGGSEIDPVYVPKGEKVTEPEDPTIDGGYLKDWYTDEELTEEYNFNTPVNDDITLHAKWYFSMSVSNYDINNHTAESGGKYTFKQGDWPEGDPMYGCSNMTNEEGSKLIFKAYNDVGYKFLGWYKGVYTGDMSGQAAEPLDINDPDNLLSNDTTYEFTVEEYAVICAVFEVCTEHSFGEDQIQKATPEENGRVYHTCTLCGEEEDIAPIPAVSNISLEADSFTYTGSAIEPKVTVANVSEELSPDCYDVKYTNNVNAGTATATVTLKGDYHEGTKKLTYKINAKKVTPTVSLWATSYTFDGKVKKPGVTVKVGSKKLTADDYTVSYASGRKNVGTYKVTVKLKGNYTGSASASFKINPKGTTLSTLTPASQAITVKWNKQDEKMASARITGYQIQLATDANFTKNKKGICLSGYNMSGRKFTGLKGGTKYYVRIRTYKKIGDVTYYSGWSETKTTTTKK